jgi:DNA gyrase subunit B
MTKKKITIEDKIKNYSANDLTALTPLAHLRTRLNLTFGEERGGEDYPYSSQKNVTVREVWDNALGEVAIGVANHLRVVFYKDGSIKIEDNGRGIPTDISTDAYGKKVSGIFKALGLLQSGSALKGVQKGKFTTSQNGVGGSSTNGVSEWFKVRVFKNKKIYALDFLDYIPGLFDDNGVFKPAKDNSEIFILKDNRSKEDKELFAHGSSVEFKLNDKWFIVPYPFDKEDIIARIRGAAYLYPHTTMEVLDEQEDGSFDKQIFNSEEGIKELVDIQVGNNITKIIDFNGATAFREKGQGHNNPNIPKGATGETLLEYINKEYSDGDLLNDERELYYNLAFNYNSGYDCIIDTYCNDIRTTLGGVHVQALEKALTDAFNTKFRSMKNGLNKNDSDVIVKDVEEGLTAVLSIKTNVPRFVGQEKQLLGGKELQKALYDSIYPQLTEWLNKGSNRDEVEIIAKKVITAMKNRTHIQEQQELNRAKNSVTRSGLMPVKLVDCEITHNPISEVYISEGDSAATGLKGARDSRYQAIFPIRGKILNVLKATSKAIMQNEETQNIIRIIDAGIGSDFKIENMRYHKIVIATDADVDGSAIANLLVTWFWVLMPEVIKQGRLFRMLTPLYEIVVSKSEVYYCVNADEKKEVEAKLAKEKKTIKEINRFKGLGETDSDVLFDTGMNPETRRMIQITVDDVVKAEEIINLISGDDTDARKDWIMANPYKPEIVEYEEEV